MHNVLRISALVATFALMACSSDKSTAPTNSSSSAASSASANACSAPTDCTPANGALIDVVCPKAGATFAAGDSVTIIWRAKVPSFSGFRPRVAANIDSAFVELATESVLATSQSPDYQCLSYKAVVPTGLTPGGKNNVSVVFRVQDYSSSKTTMRADAGLVTVTVK